MQKLSKNNKIYIPADLLDNYRNDEPENDKKIFDANGVIKLNNIVNYNSKEKSKKNPFKFFRKSDKKISGEGIPLGLKKINISWKDCKTNAELDDKLLIAIDACSYNEGNFYISGWVFSQQINIEEAYLLIKNGTGFYTSRLPYPYKRSDVANALNNGKAMSSGFNGNYLIKSEEQLEFYIVLKNGDFSYTHYLGGISPDTDVNDNEKVFICNLDEYDNYLKDKYLIADYILNDTMATDLRIDENIPIDIIIPVYNGFEYLPKLFETIKKTKLPFRLIVIDDASTDERVKSYLIEKSKEFANMKLIRNESNIGFVRSVNIGFDLVENHVALLNTDIELPENWLERLMLPILNGCASSTPFSNSATLMSFPFIGIDNSLMLCENVDEIDKNFKKIDPQYIELPTGVGFCMGINYNILKEIGPFDIVFAKGYGEENDWCRRAMNAGYKNVAVENLFVYHKHGGSFPSEEKLKLTANNIKIINNRYPIYNREVSTFFSIDPLQNIRWEIALKIISQYLHNVSILVFIQNHGVHAHIENEIGNGLNEGNAYWIVNHVLDESTCTHNEDSFYELTFKHKNISITKRFDEWNDLKTSIKGLNLGGVLIDELLLRQNIDNNSLFSKNIVELLEDEYVNLPRIEVMRDKPD